MSTVWWIELSNLSACFQVKISDFGICSAVGVDKSILEEDGNEELRLILPWSVSALL